MPAASTTQRDLTQALGPMKLADSAVAENEAILARVEALGGGYVWETEIFAISLLDSAIYDIDSAVLLKLLGVQQIALDASRLSISALRSIAGIPGLESLVLTKAPQGTEELLALGQIGPEIQLVADEA